MCLTLVGAPFDLVKVRQQSAPGQSAISVIQSVIRAKGLGGLFRGVGPPLLVSVPQFAVVFWAFDASRQLVRSWNGAVEEEEEESLRTVAIAGAMVAMPTTFIYAPVDRIKCLYQVDGANGRAARYSSVAACLRAVAWEGGVTSLFRGFRATLARDVLGCAYAHRTLSPPREIVRCSLHAWSNSYCQGESISACMRQRSGRSQRSRGNRTSWMAVPLLRRWQRSAQEPWQECLRGRWRFPSIQ